ncbi:glucose-6-phosphate dehydrogenase, variant [Spizellomyces punctatus DAOM BR117]|uniref:Glucose-6-phosphate 1-dehydrogenase n=1 Tax=Spizellomyces punctatus (strain DAOM BR117) TaxID=645134 RepID=A0A0L0HFI2_SPIPD|nr:glucose-6-phosphate dehydrogenase, variant [Spizellomyces punctatus DAOM BR117]KND00231.1 glucose-6-phosphate dehydrogenase, variant [Spizellomyces punctatus DAOM BR117]|eukprot:XP_016608270.1 glucose-6-phosphate dehydrogenase, variant [Spizellomyces punctatus DAOM BR117]
MNELPFRHVAIVVFGASGDLAKKMTYPALFSLMANNMLPKDRTHFIGAARSKYKMEDFHKKISSGIKSSDQQVLSKFLEKCPYISLSAYDDGPSYQRLDSEIAKLESQSTGSGKNLRVYYIALPPSVFGDVSENLRKYAWHKEGINRIIVEKPYGKDYQSAKVLSNKLASLFTEEEVFRIDHYLGKDSVKSVLPLRFGANPFLSSTWSREHVQYVTVNFKEAFGAEGRGGYFDEFGIIRDVMQNHLMQWIILAGMERPNSLSVKDIHQAKLKFINDCRPVRPSDVIIGQYTASSKDPNKKAYKDDETVKKDSKASTFATAVLYIDNDRWRDVPFVIRCGKALDETRAELTLHYKTPPDSLFPSESGRTGTTFTIRDHPEKSHVLTATTKKPGRGFTVLNAPLSIDFSNPKYTDSYVPTAYEVLIYDAVRGDHTWFVPREEAEEAWRVWDDAIKNSESRNPLKYEYGSEGPKEEKDLLKQLGVEFETGEGRTVDVAKVIGDGGRVQTFAKEP